MGLKETSITDISKDCIVPVGKFKGQDIVDIFDLNEDYFKWMYEEMEYIDNFPYFKNILENMIISGTPF